MAVGKCSDGGLAEVSSDKVFVQSEADETVFFFVYKCVVGCPFAVVVIVAVKGCFYNIDKIYEQKYNK